ncbi:hypothetical protein LTS18_014487 [Coniosporium uncinatum]|uniref:Uncharacterized protein n=1 Tax=Coniosporium uncinatum TaxID=93489 RepID=A0ACC3DV09_9PEZI|nr:hypothetical protein LTS18_014487 [Coniosporium uncinatum]
MRRSRLRQPPSQMTPCDVSGTLCRSLFRELRRSSILTRAVESSPTEIFINDTSTDLLSNFAAKRSSVDLGNVAEGRTAARLGLVLNTFYQLSLAPVLNTGNIPATWSEFKELNLGLYPLLNSTVTETTTILIHTVSWGWWFVLLLSSIILLILSLAGCLAGSMTHIPQIFGFVSTLAWNNRYMHDVSTGELGGYERARLLRDVQVRIGDVQAHKEIGHIAFAKVVDASVKDEEYFALPVRKGRRYE